jgi:hypothetical protein
LSNPDLPLGKRKEKRRVSNMNGFHVTLGDYVNFSRLPPFSIAALVV